jgi:L-alanine-DL-glutamate epimerase-like enolase superfamily enzyme
VKITQVAVNVVRVPVDHPYRAGGRTVDANWHVLARLTTSDGIEGVGYIVYPRPDLMTTIASAARVLSPTESVVLISTSCFKISRASRWFSLGDCATATVARTASLAGAG